MLDRKRYTMEMTPVEYANALLTELKQVEIDDFKRQDDGTWAVMGKKQGMALTFKVDTEHGLDELVIEWSDSRKNNSKQFGFVTSCYEKKLLVLLEVDSKGYPVNTDYFYDLLENLIGKKFNIIGKHGRSYFKLVDIEITEKLKAPSVKEMEAKRVARSEFDKEAQDEANAAAVDDDLDRIPF